MQAGKPLSLVALAAATAALAAVPTPAQAQRGWGDSGSAIRCESSGPGRTWCSVPVARGAAVFLVSQLPGAACVEGRTWGWDSRGIWVSQGCNGDFEVRQAGGAPLPPHRPAPHRPPPVSPPGGGPGWGGRDEIVRCESDRYRYRLCPVRIGRRGVELARQTSRTRCEFGRTWGWDRRGIWVDEGCSGEFRVRR